jgi:hypothetical protein
MLVARPTINICWGEHNVADEAGLATSTGCQRLLALLGIRTSVDDIRVGSYARMSTARMAGARSKSTRSSVCIVLV